MTSFSTPKNGTEIYGISLNGLSEPGFSRSFSKEGERWVSNEEIAVFVDTNNLAERSPMLIRFSRRGGQLQETVTLENPQLSEKRSDEIILCFDGQTVEISQLTAFQLMDDPTFIKVVDLLLENTKEQPYQTAAVVS